jgi:hypothetical protein
MPPAKSREYCFSDGYVSIDAHALSKLKEADQIDIMRDWFYQNFELPEKNTPHESAEGGYIYIWGGPYDAREELEAEFFDLVPGPAIKKLANELLDISPEWTGKPAKRNIFSYLASDIINIDYDLNFQASIQDIVRLTNTEVDASLRNSFHRLLYANIISVLEAYLADAFMKTTLRDPNLVRKFVETTPYFKNEKIKTSEIYSKMEGLERMVTEFLGNVIWHRLELVKGMYKDTLGIDLPGETPELFDAILIRHDIVHRNGKTKEGVERNITLENISRLLTIVRSFVDSINTQLAIRELGSTGGSTNIPTSGLD